MSSVASQLVAHDLRWLVGGDEAHLFVAGERVLAMPGHPPIELGELKPWPLVSLGAATVGRPPACAVRYWDNHAAYRDAERTWWLETPCMGIWFAGEELIQAAIARFGRPR